MSGNRILGERDVNVTMTDAQPLAKDVKSMEYHRQVLQSRIAQEPSKQYISPSDTIMSPCTAKLSAFRNKQVAKAKPKSLFAQASTKKFQGENPFGAKPTQSQSQSQSPLGTRKALIDGVLTSRIR